MTKFPDHFFEVEPGIRLHYLDEGQGQPIVFVPGWCFSADVFEKQIAHFSDRHRCIALNPRCHGKSTITHQGNTYNQQGADLAKLIAAMGLQDVILAGWSYGALACWAYCEQQGLDNLAAVITMDNSPRSISDDEAEYRAGTLEGLRNDHWFHLQTPGQYRDFMGGFADGLLYEGKLDADTRQELIDTACGIPCEIADMLYLDGWLSDKRDICHKIDETLPSLLVIANYRKDAGVPYMREHYPRTQIDAFGMHMMFHEYADRFNRLMDEFLTQKVRRNK